MCYFKWNLELVSNTLWIIVDKILGKIKEIIRIKNFDDTKILIERDGKLPDDVTLKDAVRVRYKRCWVLSTIISRISISIKKLAGSVKSSVQVDKCWWKVPNSWKVTKNGKTLQKLAEDSKSRKKMLKRGKKW